jgi:CRP-like cAMP-binding protein
MIINVLKLQLMDEEEVLFNQGDTGTRFYIILSGKIGIFIRRQ